MPPPEVYEDEYRYWPWGRLLSWVSDWVSTNAPPSGFVLDYMCGTGYLLNQISTNRPDLRLSGCTIEPRSYVDYAQRVYPSIDVVYRDAMAYRPVYRPDIIVCTGSLHHLKRSEQPVFLEKVAGELDADGFFVLGEAITASFDSEIQRRLALMEMWTALAQEIIVTGPPDTVLYAAVDVLANDLFEIGEYKTSYTALLAMLKVCFDVVTVNKTWPHGDSLFGDFVFVCRKKGNSA